MRTYVNRAKLLKTKLNDTNQTTAPSSSVTTTETCHKHNGSPTNIPTTPQTAISGEPKTTKIHFKSLKIYLAHNKRMCDVCRICFCAIQDNDMFTLAEENNEEITKLRNMLKEVLPDLDLQIYQNCVICKKCKTSLVASFELKATWLTTEEKLRRIFEKQKGDCGENVVLVAVKTENTLNSVENTASNEHVLPFEDHKETFPAETHQDPLKELPKNDTEAPDTAEEEVQADTEKNSNAEVSKRSKGVGNKRVRYGPCLCEQCGRFLYNLRSLKRHQKSHLKAIERQAVVNTPSICHVCGVMYPNLILLKRHMFNKHSKKPLKERYCEICKRKFHSKYYYQQHLRRMHMKTMYSNDVQCHLCGKRLKGGYLRQHLQIHKGKKPFACKICDMKFLWQVALRKHMRKHSNTMFSCEFCGKSIKYNYTLKHHIKVFHTNEGKFNCDVCGRPFTKRLNVINHKIKVHGWTHLQKD